MKSFSKILVIIALLVAIGCMSYLIIKGYMKNQKLKERQLEHVEMLNKKLENTNNKVKDALGSGTKEVDAKNEKQDSGENTEEKQN